MIAKTRNFFVVLLTCCLVLTGSTIPDDNKDDVLLRLIMESLERGHFLDRDLDDQFSKDVFGLYMEQLDFGKRFLTNQDIKLLKRYENKIDDQLKTGSTEFFDFATSLIQKRIKEAELYYQLYLSRPFDYDLNEHLETDSEKRSFAENATELKDYWRKYLKYQTLLEYQTLLLVQEKEAETSKDSSPEKIVTPATLKSFDMMEEEAREKVKKTFKDYFGRLADIEHEDRLSEYVNSITASYDPHTTYMAPEASKNFDMRISGQMEGIGARLQDKEGQITVVEIVPGSAAAKQGELQVDDVILKVAQGDEDPLNVVGMRTTKAVKYIRGKKGTEVRLTVQKMNGDLMNIPIIRDVVVIEETFAKSALLEAGGNKVGYIHLPKFYMPFNGRPGRSSFTDVKKEIEKIKDENPDGIVLDLRFNGGGSLSDVVDMAGLFIESGPIVQVKSNNNPPIVLRDKDPSVQYDGPLVILINNYSASASEIMAAALQDYDRAIVVGSDKTHGKGSVQRVFNLDAFLPGTQYEDIKPLGNLKVTIQKFYRIDGTTNQLKGVLPDIAVPDAYAKLEIGEAEEKFALKDDEIEGLKFKKWSVDYDINRLEANSKKRIDNSPVFQKIIKQADHYKSRREESQRALQLDQYEAEQKRIKEKNKVFDKLYQNIDEMTVLNLKADLERFETDTIAAAQYEKWFVNLRKDPYIFEAVSIINDIEL